MLKKFVSGIMMTLLFIGMFSLAIGVKPAKSTWTGTVYIRADGSIDPPDAPIITYDNVTYTLTDNITSTANGIIVERDNIVIDGAGYTLEGTGSGYGVCLDGRSNVTIKSTTITNFNLGIRLYGCSNNIISGNNITNNGCGIWGYSSNNIINGNNIAANNDCGIGLHYSSNNSISGNNIAANDEFGIWLSYPSNNNSICGNNIAANNYYGISLFNSSNNVIYHNNFVNNTEQVHSWYSTNVWDDGYPSGGNYWSDYTSVDSSSGLYQNETGSDGIGDTAYIIGENNVDRYPLMAPFSAFDAGVWNGTAYHVDIISNSSLSNFNIDTSGKTVSFNVTGEENQTGFCRITIPNVIVQDLWHGNYTVLLNGELWPFTDWTDNTNTYIYVNYTHSTHQITIIPELPSNAMLTLLMLTILTATILLKKKRKTKAQQIPKFPRTAQYADES